MQAVWHVALGFGAAAVAALVVLYRRVAARHELDEADRIIAEHDRSRVL